MRHSRPLPLHRRHAARRRPAPTARAGHGHRVPHGGRGRRCHRAGAAGSGPVLGQIAAYAMVLAVKTSRPPDRRAEPGCEPPPARCVRPASTSAHCAAPSNGSRHRCVTPRRGGWHCPRRRPSRGGGGHRHRGRARPAAGTGRRPALEALVDALDSPPQSIDLLVHGDGGPISGGLVGTTFAVLGALQSDERHPRLADGGGADDGGRPKRRLAG